MCQALRHKHKNTGSVHTPVEEKVRKETILTQEERKKIDSEKVMGSES